MEPPHKCQTANWIEEYSIPINRGSVCLWIGLSPGVQEDKRAGGPRFPAFFLSFRIISGAPSFGTESRAAVA